MSELNKHTRLFKNVKMCKDLNWQEKAILSEIISYQLDEKPFKLKDITIAIELGMDKGTVSKFINRLYKKGLINKTTVSYPSHEGGKPKRLRTVSVINIEQWTEKGKTIPTVLTIEKKHKVVNETAIEPTNETPVSQPETKPIEPIVVEQPTSEAETSSSDKTEKKDIPTISYYDEVSFNQHFYDEVVEQILKGEQINYIPINVYYSSDKIKPDEAISQDVYGKVLIKSKLMSLRPELFKQ